MTTLIALAGAAGAGKDTAAEALLKVGYRRDAFADRMRTAILALDPTVDFMQIGDGTIAHVKLSWLIDQFGWDHAKREYPEVRRLLQKFGTEAGRDIHGPNCWVDLVFNSWEEAGFPRTVITDCRFPNEAQAVRNNGGLVVQIVRPGIEALPGGHASENGIPAELVDHVVTNAGTIDDLHHLVRLLVA